jgi:hypothetical protein
MPSSGQCRGFQVHLASTRPGTEFGVLAGGICIYRLSPCGALRVRLHAEAAKEDAAMSLFRRMWAILQSKMSGIMNRAEYHICILSPNQ